MARYTHLAREKDEPAIRRGGIEPTNVPGWVFGVFAMPVLPQFFASHQWLRELRRRGTAPLVAIDLFMDDEEPVQAGHYNRPPVTMTAAEAAGVIMHAD